MHTNRKPELFFREATHAQEPHLNQNSVDQNRINVHNQKVTTHKFQNTQTTNYSKSNLIILHQNVQEVSNKINRLQHLVEQVKPDITILTEHGLNSTLLTNTVLVSGFSLKAHFSRSNHRKGGVCIHVKKSIENCTESIDVSQYCDELTFEAALIKVKVNKKIIYILGTYRPPHGNLEDALKALSALIENTKIDKFPLIIMGDINVDLLKPDRKNILVSETLASHNAVRLQLPPTRITHLTQTSIDWICTNMDTQQLTSRVINAGLSDHTAQSCTINCIPIQTNLVQNRRSLKNENLQYLKYLLGEENWFSVLSKSNAEEAFKTFSSTVNLALNTACPLKKIKLQHNHKPKFNSEPKAKKLKDEFLDSLYKFEKTGYLTDKKLMAERKKKYDLHLKQLRKKANSDYINSSDNKSKALWTTINTAWSRKDTSVPEINLHVDGKLIDNANEVAEQLNFFFTHVADKTLEKQKLMKTQAQTTHTQLNIPQLSSFKETNEKEVGTLITRFKTKNSSGLDEISSKILKYCSNELIRPLTHVINMSLQSGHFPSQLKISKVYPKLKKGSPSEPSNYRPISLVPTFAKLYEKIVLERLLSHCTVNNLLNNSQHGFTKGKSTTSAIIQIVELLIDSLDKGNLTTGIFLDFSKAFDCLDHQLIINKLEDLGVANTAKKWFQSYLEDRRQLVILKHKENGIIKETKSSLQCINRGVPQGSVLGPVLFILFTSDLPRQIGDNCNTLMYADDTTLIINDPTTAGLEIRSFVSLNMAYQYCHSNDLVVNTSKTMQLAFGRGSHLVPSLPEVEMVNETKFLGITLDKNLSWTPHVDNLCKKLSSSLYAMKRIREATDEETTRVAYFALFESHLRYGIIAWGATSATNMQRVLKLQKRAIRTLAGLQRLDSCRETFKSLRILTVITLYIKEAVIHVANQDLTRRGETHRYNLRNTTQYNLPAHRLTQFEKKPTYTGMKLRNHLPSYLRNKNVEDLGPALHQWLLEHPFYSMEEFTQQKFD